MVFDYSCYLVERLIGGAILFAAIVSFAQLACALGIVRDDEAEILLKELVKPLLIAANLDPERMEIYIIDDDSVNAFTAGGQMIFVHQGLLKMSHAPDIFVGVMAHEIGHIVLGHVARVDDKISDALNPIKTISLGILSGAAAVITGNPALLSMMLAGPQSDFLYFTRIQESAADIMAVQLMRKSHIRLDGLMDAMTYFKKHEHVTTVGRTHSYNRTHPLPGDRLIYLRGESNKGELGGNYAGTEGQRARFAVVVDKLRAYTEPIDSVKAAFHGQRTFSEKYAMIVLYLRMNELSDAGRIVNDLIAEAPNNPYLFEMRAYINNANGMHASALEDIGTADRLLDHKMTTIRLSHISWRLRLGLKPDELADIIAEMHNEATRAPHNIPALYVLANAYSAANQNDMSHVTLAFLNITTRNVKQALKHIQIARQLSGGNLATLARIEEAEHALAVIEKKSGARKSIADDL